MGRNLGIGVLILFWGWSACSKESGPDVTAIEKQGCEVQCRLVFECAQQTPEAVNACINACAQALEQASPACREATAQVGTCAKDKSCDELEAGNCIAPITSAQQICDQRPEGGEEGDGGVPDGQVQSEEEGCERFGFVASGQECPLSGCSSIQCTCEEGFPRSLTACEDDGCIISADCDAVCAADSLFDALECTGTYTLAP